MSFQSMLSTATEVLRARGALRPIARRHAPVCALALLTRATNALAQSPAAMCRPDPDGPPVPRAAFAPRESTAYILPFELGTPRLIWRTTSQVTTHGETAALVCTPSTSKCRLARR